MEYTQYTWLCTYVAVWLTIRPVMCRWKRDASNVVITKDGKPVLEFVAVKRKDCNEWAIPGVSCSSKVQ